MIATAYADVKRLPSATLEKTVMVGNPVREEIRALREQPYPALSDEGLFRVLVVGGSQGATVLTDIVPDGLGMPPPNFRPRLQVTQQCRPEAISRLRGTYARLAPTTE